MATDGTKDDASLRKGDSSLTTRSRNVSRTSSSAQKSLSGSQTLRRPPIPR
jgi:hypothetical protein